MSKTIDKMEAEKIDDVRALLKISIGRYLDYSKYWNDLAEVDELFDESVEYFDTETWVNLTAASKKGNELIINAVSSLNKSIESFRDLMESAESECKELLRQVLGMEIYIRKEIFGYVFDYDALVIDKIFEGIQELRYPYQIEDAFEMFIQFVNEKFNEKNKRLKFS